MKKMILALLVFLSGGHVAYTQIYGLVSWSAQIEETEEAGIILLKVKAEI